MLAVLLARIATYAARSAALATTAGAALWPRLVFGGAVLLALLGVYAGVRRAGRNAGRDAERADSLRAGLDTIARANDAATRLDPTREGIDRDPNNLDRVR